MVINTVRERTHESPVSPEEVFCEGVKGNAGTRALGVVEWAAHLSAGGVEAPTGSESGGHPGSNNGLSVHLEE